MQTGLPSLLHVGCGGDPLPHWFGECNETRLDIDPETNPHIVADMVSLGDIGPYDYILCQHALEHLDPHDVPTALQEFYRVLNPGGIVLLFVPDLEGVSATEEVLFVAPVGPITGLDLIYGYRQMLKAKPYMAHRTGFVSETLHEAMTQAGFRNVSVKNMTDYALMGAGKK